MRDSSEIDVKRKTQRDAMRCSINLPDLRQRRSAAVVSLCTCVRECVYVWCASVCVCASRRQRRLHNNGPQNGNGPRLAQCAFK